MLCHLYRYSFCVRLPPFKPSQVANAMRCEGVSPSCPTAESHPFPPLPSLTSRARNAYNSSRVTEAFPSTDTAAQTAAAASGASAKATDPLMLPSVNVHDAFWYPRPAAPEKWHPYVGSKGSNHSSGEAFGGAFEESLQIPFESGSRNDDVTAQVSASKIGFLVAGSRLPSSMSFFLAFDRCS